MIRDSGFIALKAMPTPELHDHMASLGATGLLCAPWVMASSVDERVAAIEGFAAEFCR